MYNFWRSEQRRLASIQVAAAVAAAAAAPLKRIVFGNLRGNAKKRNYMEGVNGWRELE